MALLLGAQAATPTPAAAATPGPRPAATVPPAAAGKTTALAVQVTEVGGGVAYVKPGEKAGLAVGQTVQFGSNAYKIIAVSAESAAVDMATGKLAVGANGSATVAVSTARAAGGRLRAVPVGPALWGPATLPAASQAPKHVPLSAGGARAHGPFNAMIAVRASSLTPATTNTNAGPSYTGELETRADAALSSTAPLTAAADVSALGWGGDGITPAGAPYRPWARVREMSVRWGDAWDPIGEAGRLRSAAWMLGALDGARARVPFGSFSLGAFGGFLPDPERGALSTEDERFGLEASWRAADTSWRPEVSVVASGSRFKGQTDERRVTASGSVFGPHGSALAYTEVSAFDKTNPWNAKPVEVTAAGADATLRVGPVRVGARADMRSPERSLWLASHFPQSWLCVAAPQPSGTPEPCTTENLRRWLGEADADLDLSFVALSAGGSVSSYGKGPVSDQESSVWGDIRTVSLPHGLRVMAGGHSSLGSLVDHYGGYVGAGRAFFADKLDLSVTWRSTVFTYRSLADDHVENRIEGSLLWLVRPNLDIGLMGDSATGSDARASMFLFTLVWRPSFARHAPPPAATPAALPSIF
ncbi:MAG TPA: hypothetical protein VMV18_11105 [bacterium]|nr:hypothetical protein [bacterium]